MTTGNMTPALELAVALIAEGRTIPAYLCEAQPAHVVDIEPCSLGVGVIDASGGLITVHRAGVAVCFAYDVNGELVTTTTTGMPCRVQEGAQCRVGPLTFGKDGKPHDTQ